MYIEYIAPQKQVNGEYTKRTRTFIEGYRPTWLIRTRDWVRVPGTDATHGYHTLSYCWEQSGEKIQRADGEYDLVDNGHHRITYRDQALEKREEIDSRYVTYNELLQKLCKDFEIAYLWYDKICIDQTNKEEKQREIRQMHRIYSNSIYTVALVPEVYFNYTNEHKEVPWSTVCEAKTVVLEQITKSRWWKRSWTLEETMMSDQLLIVGRNVHMWCTSTEVQLSEDVCREDDFISTEMLGFRATKERSFANVLLRYAHTRTSTKEHDKIFSLANILNKVVSIDVDYSIDVSVIMKQFYRQLAERDLSIMCFGAASTAEEGPECSTTVASQRLPSWTGAYGRHTLHQIWNIVADGNEKWAIDDEMRLHITCRSYIIRSIKTYDAHQYNALLGDEADIDTGDYYSPQPLQMDTATGCSPTHYWVTTSHSAFHPYKVFPLSLTEDCAECTIPAILFNSAFPGYDTDADGHYPSTDHYDYLLPVLKKSDNAGIYKAVGIIQVRSYWTYGKKVDEFFDGPDSSTVELIIE